MEKIKLAWIGDTIRSESSSFDFKSHSKLFFVVYYGLKKCVLYKKEAYEKTLGFPQDHPIQSLEEGRKFCQDWLDNLVDTENRKERVMKVVEDILEGRTKLAWELSPSGANWAKILINNEHFNFTFNTKAFMGKLFFSHDYGNFNDAHDKFGIKSVFRSKDECQIWYDKFLLEQATK